MKLKSLWLLLVMFMILLGLSGCLFGGNDLSKQGVCILADTSLRTEPSKKGDWISSLALGETVKLESGAIKDAADPNTEYIKVKLSDGTKGYANSWCIVRGAYVGVIQTPSKLYKRPDLLAESDQKLEIMNIVAVQEEKDNWLRVTSEGRAKSGWIQKDAVRKDKEDVVTAVLLKKAIRGKENSLSREELEEIVSKLPYPNNYFVDKIMEKYEATDETEQNQQTSEDTTNGNETPVNQ